MGGVWGAGGGGGGGSNGKCKRKKIKIFHFSRQHLLCVCIYICVKEIHTCLSLRLNLGRKCEPGLIAWFSYVNARLNFSGSIPLKVEH